MTVFSLNAQAGGVLSIGIDYLMMTAELNGAEAEPSAIQLRVSTGLTPIVDIEGILATSLDDDKFPGGATIDLSSLTGVYAKAGFDAIPLINIYGKLGYVSYEFEFSGGAKVDDSGVAYGVGVEIDIPVLGTIIVEQNFYPDIEDSGVKIETSVFSIGYHVGL